jgi:hypothetical protein
VVERREVVDRWPPLSSVCGGGQKWRSTDGIPSPLCIISSSDTNFYFDFAEFEEKKCCDQKKVHCLDEQKFAEIEENGS